MKQDSLVPNGEPDAAEPALLFLLNCYDRWSATPPRAGCQGTAEKPGGGA